MLHEGSAPRGLDERDRAAEVVGAAHATVTNGPRESVAVEAGETRQSRGAFAGGQTRVNRYPALRRFVERAYRRRVKRVAAALTQRELPSAADLLDQLLVGLDGGDIGRTFRHGRDPTCLSGGGRR